MKKNIVRAFCLLLCAALLAGCGAKTENTPDAKLLYGKAADEIHTYEKIDPDKTQLVIGVAENDDVTALADAFAEKYPDVQPIVYSLQKGDSSYSPAKEWIKHGYLPDVVYNVDFGSEDADWLEDLSGRTAAGAYEAQALTANDNNGSLYCLPGPAKVMAVAYNETMFEQYGWTVPETFDEFTALCARITEDTGGTVEPYNPNGKYATDFSGGMEAFAYGALFAGVENRTWYQDVLSGTAEFGSHMLPYFSMLEKLTGCGALTADDFDYSYTARTQNFLTGKIAMINVFTDLDTANDAGYRFAYTAFPALDGGKQYLSTRQSYNLSVVKKDRTDAQEQAVDEYLNFVSTPEAQQICIGDSLMISSVKNTPINDALCSDSLRSAIADGRYFKRLDFNGYSVPETFVMLDELRSAAKSVASGEKTAEAASDELGAALKSAVESPPSAAAPEKIGTASSDFTVLQTSEYIADVFRAKTGADIALIPDNIPYRGNIQRFFQGDITDLALKNLSPRSLDSKSALVKVSMTGENLLKALNAPQDYNGAAGNCIYAFSGLKAEAAPWNETGFKYLSVTLADGAAIEAGKTYTVAFWQGMVADEFITETLETWDGTYAEILSGAISAAGTISPPDDGRLKLVWD